MQHGSVFGDVDRLAGEHRVTAGLHAGRVSNRDKGGEDGIVDRVLRVVDPKVADVDHVPFGPAGVALEQLGQRTRDRVAEQRLPLRRRGDVAAEDAEGTWGRIAVGHRP